LQRLILDAGGFILGLANQARRFIAQGADFFADAEILPGLFGAILGGLELRQAI
jgi:hypothetical protein